MPDYRVMTRLPWQSGLPSDVTVNVWHFQASLVADLEDVFDALVLFYQTIDTNMSSLISNSADACSMSAYDLADPEPRAPKAERTFTLSLGTNTLPPEIALCLSFQANQVSGQPQARRRGRVYLGPWSPGVTQSNTGRPTSGLVDAIRDAAQVLLDASQAAGGWAWQIFSPTNNNSPLVDNGWVDDEWDIQRRRGRLPTERLTFS